MSLLLLLHSEAAADPASNNSVVQRTFVRGKTRRRYRKPAQSRWYTSGWGTEPGPSGDVVATEDGDTLAASVVFGSSLSPIQSSFVAGKKRRLRPAKYTYTTIPVWRRVSFATVTATVAVTEDEDVLVTTAVSVQGTANIYEDDALLLDENGQRILDENGAEILTKASGADVLVASGTATNTVGALAVTEDGDVLAGAGSSVKGTLAITEAPDVLVGSAGLGDVSGAVTVTEDEDVLVAVGGSVGGDIVVTEDEDVLVASVAHGVTGDVTATEDDDVLAGALEQTLLAAGAATEDDDGAAIAADHGVNADGVATEDDDTLAAVGTEHIGAFEATEADDVLVARGRGVLTVGAAQFASGRLHRRFKEEKLTLIRRDATLVRRSDDLVLTRAP